MTAQKNEVDDIVNQTGYPLQVALEGVIENLRKVAKLHGWDLLFHEHRWVNANKEGYIDLVVRSLSTCSGPVIHLVIECKRIDGVWAFIVPPDAQSPEREALVLTSEWISGKQHAMWKKKSFGQESVVSEYCVMADADDKVGLKKDGRILESWANELLMATEALASEHASLVSNPESSIPEQIYIPVIVTTAQIRVCILPASKVSLEDGKMTECKLEDNHWCVRFQKNMTTSLEYSNEITSLEQAHKANQRTVFVVHAAEFESFLEKMWFS